MHRGLTAAATNVKQTQDRLAEGFLENEFADDQQARASTQEQDTLTHRGLLLPMLASRHRTVSLQGSSLVRFSLVTISVTRMLTQPLGTTLSVLLMQMDRRQLVE